MWCWVAVRSSWDDQISWTISKVATAANVGRRFRCKLLHGKGFYENGQEETPFCYKHCSWHTNSLQDRLERDDAPCNLNNTTPNISSALCRFQSLLYWSFVLEISPIHGLYIRNHESILAILYIQWANEALPASRSLATFFVPYTVPRFVTDMTHLE